MLKQSTALALPASQMYDLLCRLAHAALNGNPLNMSAKLSGSHERFTDGRCNDQTAHYVLAGEQCVDCPFTNVHG